MKITTIAQVLNLADTLNKVYEAENVTTHEMTIHGIESVEDLKALAKQEDANHWQPSGDLNYHWIAVKLGKIEFILTNRT